MGYTPPYLDVRKVAGGWSAYGPSPTTTDDLTLYANTTDATANLYVLGNGGFYFDTAAGSGIYHREVATARLLLVYESVNNQYKIESTTDAKDLYLATTGTGVLKFGTYTAGAATDSTGYITIKDAAGNTRKLMVQA